MSDIFDSSLEEPPKNKKNRVLLQLMKNLWRTQWVHQEAHKETHMPTMNVLRTLLFTVLLNNEDGNRLITQPGIPFWSVALGPLSHDNNNFLLWNLNNIDIYLRRDLVFTKLATPINKSFDYIPESVNLKWENPMIYRANFTQWDIVRVRHSLPSFIMNSEYSRI